MVTPSRGGRIGGVEEVPVANGVVMGHYEVEGVLGRGGMGVVLAARDRRSGREVAIKVLEVGGETNIGRFEREARVVAALESEHLAKFIESGQHANMPYIVMERLRGEDFGALAGRALIPLSVVADCIIQACEALAHAHGAGVIHRDIKASNLFEHELPDGSRIVKVLDFGISKCREQMSSSDFTLTRTREGIFLGSPRYMSPEQFRNPRRVDGRADLWSLGIVAYRLLSGTFPYAGETSVDVFAAILETTPPTLHEIGIDVPPEVEAVIGRCLARKREDRFANAAELARAFAPFATARWHPLVDRIAGIVRQHPPVLAESQEVQAGKARARAEAVAMQRTVTVSGDEDSRSRPSSRGTPNHRSGNHPVDASLWEGWEARAQKKKSGGFSSPGDPHNPRTARISSTPPPESHSRKTPQSTPRPATFAGTVRMDRTPGRSPEDADPFEPIRPVEPFAPMEPFALPRLSDEPIEPTAIIEPTVFIEPSELMKKQAKSGSPEVPPSAPPRLGAPLNDMTEPFEMTALMQPSAPGSDALLRLETKPLGPAYQRERTERLSHLTPEPMTPVPPTALPRRRSGTLVPVLIVAIFVLLIVGLVLTGIAVRHGRLGGGSGDHPSPSSLSSPSAPPNRTAP